MCDKWYYTTILLQEPIWPIEIAYMENQFSNRLHYGLILHMPTLLQQATVLDEIHSESVADLIDY